MHRIRVRYTKLDRVRFVSARDLTSVWERALRRADLPIAYSEGFSPHAKVSFPDALPVGVASTGEYAELTFAAPIDVHEAMRALSASLPDGMDILIYLVVPDGAPKLARMLRATMWELALPAGGPHPDTLDELRRRSHLLLASDHREVVRRHAQGDRTIDVRPSILALHASTRRTDAGPAPVLRAVLRNDGPTVRPTDLFAALAAPDDPSAQALPAPRVHVRVAQGEPVDGGLREALSGEVERLDLERHAGAA